MILELSLIISSITSFRVLPADKRQSIFGFSISQSTTDELGDIMPVDASVNVDSIVSSKQSPTSRK